MLCSTKDIMLRNVNILDVIKKRQLYDHDILIAQGRFACVEPHIEQRSDLEIDCTGLWAMPSMVDMHTHIAFDPLGYQYEYRKQNVIFLAIANLYQAAQAGVCLIRDLGWSENDNAPLREFVSSARSAAFPEVEYAGIPICIQEGHGCEFSNAVNIEDLAQWIGQHKEDGCSWIKIMNGPETHDLAYLRDVSEIAHKQGLKVACHAFTPVGVADAIAAQVDTIEHAVPFDTCDLNMPISFVPTVYSAVTSCDNTYLSSVESVEEAQYLKDWLDNLRRTVPAAIGSGMRLLAGTDGGCAPSAIRDIFNEIRCFAASGMACIDAIRSATLLPSMVLGREALYGSITVGKYANMLLTKKDPSTDLSQVSRPEYIFLRGIMIVDRGLPCD